MAVMQRAFTNILVNDPDRAASFYEQLLGMSRHFSSDWFVILNHPDVSGLEFGLLQRDNEIIPDTEQAPPSGVMQTFVVENVDDVYAIAQSMNVKIIEQPTDMPYGQRRMLLKDIDGLLIDVSSPTAPTPQT